MGESTSSASAAASTGLAMMATWQGRIKAGRGSICRAPL